MAFCIGENREINSRDIYLYPFSCVTPECLRIPGGGCDVDAMSIAVATSMLSGGDKRSNWRSRLAVNLLVTTLSRGYCAD